MIETNQSLAEWVDAVQAFNPVDPFYGLGWQGRGVVSKTVTATVSAQDAKPRFCLRRGASSRSAQQKTWMIPSPRNHTR